MATRRVPEGTPNIQQGMSNFQGGEVGDGHSVPSGGWAVRSGGSRRSVLASACAEGFAAAGTPASGRQ